jgi:Uma2 family endonuclease
MAIARQPGGRFRDEEDIYPSSDGKPMGETDKHIEQMFYLIQALKLYFAARPEVYVAGNNFIYFEEGNPKARISPDCYVVFGAGMRLRNSYMTWKEGHRLPDVVFEITSRKTRKEDVQTKRPLYEQRMRVPEYFLFDPTGDYLKPRFQGYRLLDGQYAPLLPVEGRLHSEKLGLDLVQQGDVLRLYDPQRGEWLPTSFERAKREEEAVRRAEEAAREAATALRQAEEAAQETVVALRRAEEAEQRAEAEAKARAEAEAEIARLRAEIERRNAS